ncbi:ABC transporter permease [Paenibacillus hexagrammi]|uniref:ABC transporter permease n=1 Tax=Paenibacillus hexagrammi TaxID=2908839 RepID=A0ABY3SIB3_9BACL|nr:ABC transporter permease [Paenibacillus sp. YPD9-1]UJF33764.1 ABC transporter permease [Paenibacillus sp. YPD9-1]
MTFPQFAYKNVLRNLRSYLAFYLSSSFAVMIFYMFAMFIFHPALKNGYINTFAKKGMVFAEWIIFIFSILFILYSVSAFLKTRSKEFGILTILGISPMKFRWLITLENMIIGIASILTGIVGGTVLAKMFFTAGTYIVEMEPLPLYVPWKAIIVTAVVFFLLFMIISQFTLFTIYKKNTLALLKGTQKPKKEPKPSLFFTVLGTLFLVTGFGMALTAEIDTKNLVVILISTVFGTYFFYSQLSVWMLKLLKRSKTFYRKGMNLLWVSDLMYRVRDNARLFFIVSIVLAVTFTAIGTLATVKSSFSQQESLYEMEYLSYSINQEEQQQVQFIEKQFASQNIDYTEDKFEAIQSKYKQGDHSSILIVISEISLPKQILERVTVTLADQEGILFGQINTQKVHPELQLFDQQSQVSIDLRVHSYEKPILSSSDVLIVNENTFKQLHQHFKQVSFIGFNFENWKESLDISRNIESHIVGKTYNPDANYVSKAIHYFITVQMPSLSLFIGLFIAIVFFIASGSFLYFRLFTDLYEEREKYKSLAKIGLSEAEMAKSASIQMAILFFLPFVLAVVDTGFALHILQREGGYINVVPSGVLTIIGFFLLQLLYFIMIRFGYIKNLKAFIYR